MTWNDAAWSWPAVVVYWIVDVLRWVDCVSSWVAVVVVFRAVAACCDDMRCGSVVAATVVASGHMDAAPYCGMTTNRFTLDDSDSTTAMVAGARGR